MSKCCTSIFKGFWNVVCAIGRGIKCFFKCLFCCCCCAKKEIDDSEDVNAFPPNPSSPTYQPPGSVSASLFKADKATQVDVMVVRDHPWPDYKKPTQIEGLESVSVNSPERSSGDDSAPIINVDSK